MPKLSPTMEEGQISRWVKNEGDKFEANETLAEVDTDKATMEMTALSGGTLLKILKGDGETAALGETIAIIGNQGEDISALLKEVSANGSAKPAAAAEKPEAPAGKAAEPQPEKKSAPAAETPRSSGSGASVPTSGGRLIISPIAARIAAENNVDLKSLTGSGPNGRIIKRDVEEALAGNGQRNAAKPFTPATLIGLTQSLTSIAQIAAPLLAGKLIDLHMLTTWAVLTGAIALAALFF